MKKETENGEEWNSNQPESICLCLFHRKKKIRRINIERHSGKNSCSFSLRLCRHNAVIRLISMMSSDQMKRDPVTVQFSLE